MKRGLIMEEFLKELGIQGTPQRTDDGTYVLDIEGPDNYGRIYSRLDRSALLEEDEDASQLTFDTSSIRYQNDEYMLTLLADFNEDTYQLVIQTKEPSKVEPEVDEIEDEEEIEEEDYRR